MPDPSRLLTDHEHSQLYIGQFAALTGATRKAIRLRRAFDERYYGYLGRSPVRHLAQGEAKMARKRPH